MTAKAGFRGGRALGAAAFVAAASIALPAASYEYEMGRQFFDANDYGAARVQWQPLARRGDLRSLTALNQLYHVQGATPAEIEEATELTLRAAERLDDWTAQVGLATLYTWGQGVPLDPARARDILIAAAMRGGGPTVARLGAMYVAGNVVPQDLAEGMTWLRKAVALGDASAAQALGDIHLDGRGVEQNYWQAYMWFHLAASLLPRGEARDEALRSQDFAGLYLSAAEMAEARREAQRQRPE